MIACWIRFPMKPAASLFMSATLRPMDSSVVFTIATVSGLVYGLFTTSTQGTRCGGFHGCATISFSFCFNPLARSSAEMAEVDEAIALNWLQCFSIRAYTLY